MKNLFPIAALIVVALTKPATSRECIDGSTAALKVAGWSAKAVEVSFSRGVELSMTLENVSGHGIRMIDGRVFFDDILGRNISSIEIANDASIPADGSFTQSGRYQTFGGADITRLATAEASDLVLTVCVKAMVTTEGEVLRFD